MRLLKRRQQLARPLLDRCMVCLRPTPAAAALLCRLCQRSLRTVDDTHYALIHWAARRARRFAKRSAREVA